LIIRLMENVSLTREEQVSTVPLRALHLCYFGLREPLVQTQVLPYLEALARAGYRMELLTFEPDWPTSWSGEERQAWREKLAARGIGWNTLGYHRSPSLLATLFDILQGVVFILQSSRSARIDLLHARSHIPLVMALLTRWWVGARVIFDLRGLLADEYVDAGHWRRGSLAYRAVKWWERRGLERADQVVVLTERMAAWVEQEQGISPGRVTVIPCCVEVPAEPAERDRPGQDLVYAGSVTGLYQLEEMAAFFEAYRASRPTARWRILTQAAPDLVRARVKSAGGDPSVIDVAFVPPAKVFEAHQGCLAGLSFRRPTFSQIAASPTKVGEYLAAGLPVISNRGIGDLDQLLERERVGIVVAGSGEEAWSEAVDRLLALCEEPELAARCRRVARQSFGMATVGGPRYVDLYCRTLADAPTRPQTVKSERNS
jgi:glycosyltransferase involved in cell wall biosynthesis